MSSSVVESPVADTVDPADRRRGAGFPAPPAAQHRTHRGGGRTPRRRCHVQLADRRATSRLDEPRRRIEGLRRRRKRVRRHARRLRRRDCRARSSGHRHGGQRPGQARNTFRAADRRRDLDRGRVGPPVRPAAVAVRQLRHRGHHGRCASRPRVDRTGSDHQGRGLLPRPPRLRAGFGAARGRGGRPARFSDSGTG